jgi:hypothetical protein
MAIRKSRVVEMKATDAGKEIPSRDELEEMLTPEIQDELAKLLTRGLKLKLETARRKNPYFKGTRRGSEHMKLSREEKSMAIRFTRYFVKGYFIVQRSYDWLVSPN